MGNISNSSKTLINKLTEDTSFTTSNLKKHQSVTSKVNAKGNDNNLTDKGEMFPESSTWLFIPEFKIWFCLLLAP